MQKVFLFRFRQRPIRIRIAAHQYKSCANLQFRTNNKKKTSNEIRTRIQRTRSKRPKEETKNKKKESSLREKFFRYDFGLANSKHQTVSFFVAFLC